MLPHQINKCSKSTIKTLRKRCESCKKLTPKTCERHYWHLSGVFNVSFWTYLSPFSIDYLLLDFGIYCCKRLLENRFFLEHGWKASTIARSFYLYCLSGKTCNIEILYNFENPESSSNILTRLFFYYYGWIQIILIYWTNIISKSNCMLKVRKRTTRLISLILGWICSKFWESLFTQMRHFIPPENIRKFRVFWRFQDCIKTEHGLVWVKDNRKTSIILVFLLLTLNVFANLI